MAKNKAQLSAKSYAKKMESLGKLGTYSILLFLTISVGRNLPLIQDHYTLFFVFVLLAFSILMVDLYRTSKWHFVSLILPLLSALAVLGTLCASAFFLLFTFADDFMNSTGNASLWVFLAVTFVAATITALWYLKAVRVMGNWADRKLKGSI